MRKVVAELAVLAVTKSILATDRKFLDSRLGERGGAVAVTQQLPSMKELVVPTKGRVSFSI